jgi:hypothetical protein
MSGGLVSVGACSSTHDVGGTSSTSTNTTSSTATSGTSSTSSTSATTDSGGGGACSLPSPGATNGTLYTGGIPNPFCPSTLASGWPNNSWFGYFDSTTAGTTDAAAFNFTHQGDTGGCDGTSDCAFHTTGANIPGYGAGVGFTLANNSNFDASIYTGFQVWLKGTTTGTRGQGFVLSPNTVHVKFITALPDGGDERNGDDYGAYCPTLSDAGSDAWVVCTLQFAGLTRDGFRGTDSGAPDPNSDVFDPQNLQKIQFEISSFTPPVDASDQTESVTFDVWIDDVAFF